MKLSGEDEARRFVTSILPEPGIRQKCLMVFADAIEEAHRCGRDRWAVRYTTDKLRLHVDHVIICTLSLSFNRGRSCERIEARLTALR